MQKGRILRTVVFAVPFLAWALPGWAVGTPVGPPPQEAVDTGIAGDSSAILRRLPRVVDAAVVEPAAFLAASHLEQDDFWLSNNASHTDLGAALSCDSFPYDGSYWLEVVARSYYINDQRIQFTGQEATFGVEGILSGAVHHEHDGWTFGLTGEFYINQPFDRNLYRDSQERVSYLGSFEVETFDIQQLVLSARRGDMLIAMGKMVTPFGRTCFPLFTNERVDAPFIRTESILWRETGLLLQYDPGILMLTTAITNGSMDRDTNSSKAVISRIGLDGGWWALGASVKFQDGIGSEEQKLFKNHVGIDGMLRWGCVTLSAEAIYDEYGFRRPDFDPLDITWRRSLYYRDQNLANHEPLTGVGYYVDLVVQGKRRTMELNYGEFYPKNMGDRRHDQSVHRGIIKYIQHMTAHADAYVMALKENDLANAQVGRKRQGLIVLAGFQYTW